MNRKEYFLLSIPIIISTVAITIVNFIIGEASSIVVNNFEMISENYISFVSILVGFLITTISIIIGFFDKKIVRIIVEKKQDKVLYTNWFLTIITGIFSILVLFYIAAVFNNVDKLIYKVPMSIFIFFMIMFVGYLIFSLMYFFGIAKFVMREDLQEEPMKKIDKEKIKHPKEI